METLPSHVWSLRTGSHSGPGPLTAWPGWLQTKLLLPPLRDPVPVPPGLEFFVSLGCQWLGIPRAEHRESHILSKAILPSPSIQGPHQLRLRSHSLSLVFPLGPWGVGVNLTITKFPPSPEHLSLWAALTSGPHPNTRQFSRSSFPLNWNSFTTDFCLPYSVDTRLQYSCPSLSYTPKLLPSSGKQNRTISDAKVIPEGNKKGAWQRPTAAPWASLGGPKVSLHRRQVSNWSVALGEMPGKDEE